MKLKWCIPALVCFGFVAYAAEKSGVPDPAIQLRDFYSFVSSMDPKKVEDRERLAKEIKARSEKAPDDWLKRVGDKQKSLKSRVESLLQGGSAQGLAAQLLAELDARRGEALAYIGGEAYTKETHPKVEEMVRKVEEIWKSPYDQFIARNAQGLATGG